MSCSRKIRTVIALLGLGSLLSFACADNPTPSDTEPPTAVTDLAAIQITSNSVVLSWTAPGDDGSSGTAAGYDVRYSTTSLSESNWNSANLAAGEPEPQPAGSSEQFEVTGLTLNESHYFGLRTYDESGNYSTLSNLAGLEVVEIFEIPIPDAQLEMLIREFLDDFTQPIYANDMAKIDTLIGGWRGISDLTGLEYCVNLKVLRLQGENINDIRPLAGLTSLESLYLTYNSVINLQPLAGLTNLRELNLEQNGISDISPLSGLTNLEWLWFKDNAISDLTPLAGLINLQTLFLRDNEIIDIGPLDGLTNLEELWLADNAITDLAPVASLTNLRTLDLAKNSPAGLAPLAGLTGLRNLYLSSNGLQDISSLELLTNLESLGLSRNQIDDLSPLAGMTNLTMLFLRENLISDIAPLSGLTDLNFLELRLNQIQDIGPLVSNSGLQEYDEVLLTDNPLSTQSINEHIPALEARGVDVEY